MPGNSTTPAWARRAAASAAATGAVTPPEAVLPSLRGAAGDGGGLVGCGRHAAHNTSSRGRCGSIQRPPGTDCRLFHPACSQHIGAGRRAAAQRQQQQLPRNLREKYGIRAARRAGRQAADGGSNEEQGRCRNQLRRKLAAAWRECNQLRGEMLEKLAQEDPQSFFLRYRR